MITTARKVLVVTDEAETLANLGRSLEEAGHKVVAVKSGADASVILRLNNLDAVVADARLPDMDGLALLEQAKKANSNVVVIILTDVTHSSAATDYLKHGAHACFVKPVSANEITTSLTNALRHQQLSQDYKKLIEELERSNRLLAITNEELRSEISHRERAEELYSILANSSPVGVYVAERRRFRFVNPQFQKYSGFTEEELFDKEALSLVHPEDREMVRQNAIQMLKGQRLAPYEFRVVGKSGEVRWAIETVASVTYRGKRATLGNFIDITESKQSQQELQRSHEVQTTINRLLRASLEARSVQELCQQTIDRLTSIPWLATAFRGCVFLVEDDPQVLVLKAQHGLAEAQRRECARVPFGQCLCGRAALSGKIEFADRLDEHHERAGEDVSPHGHYCVPMLSAGEVLGVVSLIVREGQPYNRRDAEFLLAVANLLAVGVERKRMEKKLETLLETTAKTAREWQETFDAVMDIVALISPHYEFLRVNRAGCEAVGKKPEELIGKKCYEVIHGLNAPIDGCPCAETLKTKKTHSGEITERGRHYIATASPVFDENGEIVAFTHTIKDITERKRAEEGLKESERRYRELADLLPQTIFETDIEGNFTFVNRHGYLSFGQAPDEVAQPLNVLKVLVPDDRDRAERDLQEILAGQQIAGHEYVFLRKDGSTFPAMVYAAPIFRHGQRVGLRGIAIDITERKRAEEALRQSEERLRVYLESAPDGVYLHDFKGRFLYGNKKAEQITGYQRGELIGKSFLTLNLLSARHVAKAGKLLALNMMGKPTGPDEFELRQKNGRRVWVEINTTPIKQDDKGVVISFVRDITERKLMQRELEERSEQLLTQQQQLIDKTEEVTRANDLKSQFLANMSHELRTPLNAIIGFSELMLDGVPGETNEDQKQCLTDILESSHRLLSLINEVLDLSRIEAGRVEFKQGEVVLTEVLASVTRTMIPILVPRKQTLDINVDENLPPVRADEGRLSQVLLNLADNASKFTPDSGQLRIEAIREDNWCRVSVIDNGIGIKKEDQERIFEPFCRLDNSLSRERGGTGLGLTLVRQIIEKYGGKIWVESEYGKGSRFIFTLPLAISGKQT